MKNIFYYFTHKIVFSLLFFLILIDGSKALAAHSLINCPCDSGADADVICHDGWFCPSGYEKYKSGGDLLDCESDLCGEPCCDSGERCCFRKNMEGCPEYSTCFAEEPTDLSFKWRDIGKTCVDGDGEDGKCYIPDNNYAIDECLPLPDECHSVNCPSNEACVMALNGGIVYYQCVKDHPNCDTPCEGCCAADPADCVPPGTYVEGEGVCDVGKTCYILEEDVPTCDEVGGTCRSFLCNTTPPNVETPYNGTTSDCNGQDQYGQDQYCCVPDTSWKCGTPGNECCPEPDPCETFLYYCDTATNTCVTNTCGLVGQECCLDGSDPCKTTDLECIDVSGIKTCVRVNIPKPPEMVYKGPIIESLEQVIGPVSKMLYYGGLAIGVFFIILSGYKLMTSEGDPQRVKAAQEQLTSAIVGIIFILLSVSIIRIIIEEIIVI